MKPKRITDDLDKMLGLLPPGVQKSLSNSDQQDELLEVVLDLGRIPEARYPDKVLALGDKYLSIPNAFAGPIKALILAFFN